MVICWTCLGLMNQKWNMMGKSNKKGEIEAIKAKSSGLL
jgi:hypothetical protein